MDSTLKRIAFCLATGLVAILFAGCSRSAGPAQPGQPPSLSSSQVRDWESSAEKGDAMAKYSLAKMFRDGQGVPQSATNALIWFRKSAEAGYHKAQYHLGEAYQQGEGTAASGAEAAIWYRKAAEQGNANAMEKLGFMLWKGEGTATNYVEAHKWLALAAADGEGKAAKGTKKIELSMSQQQIAEAKKLAAAFVPKKVFKKAEKE